MRMSKSVSMSMRMSKSLIISISVIVSVSMSMDMGVVSGGVSVEARWCGYGCHSVWAGVLPGVVMGDT